MQINKNLHFLDLFYFLNLFIYPFLTISGLQSRYFSSQILIILLAYYCCTRMNDSMTGYGDITFYIDVLTNDGVWHDFNSAML
jgi:hypothetical protein